MTNIEELEAALGRVKKSYAQFDSFGTTHAVLYSDQQENDLNHIEQASRTLLNLLRALDEKRMAVVRREFPLSFEQYKSGWPLDENMPEELHEQYFQETYSVDKSEYERTITRYGLDQQAILKELEG